MISSQSLFGSCLSPLAAITKSHKWGGLETREVYFLHSRRLEIQDHGQIQCLVRAGFLRGCLLAGSSHGGRGEGAPQGPFYKGTDPIVKAPPSWLINSQRPRLLMPSVTLGNRIPTNESGDTNIQIIAGVNEWTAEPTACCMLQFAKILLPSSFQRFFIISREGT